METPAASTYELDLEHGEAGATQQLAEGLHIEDPSPVTAHSNVYRALDSRAGQIRLLELLPGECSAVLRADLCTVLLNSRPYETISYVWGAPIRSAVVEIAGIELPIPEATAAVLRRIRLPDCMRLIWIDADDIDERSEQVNLMGDIYGGSTGNLIHLTDDEDMSRRIIQLADELDREICERTDNYSDWKHVVYNRGNMRYVRPKIQPHRDDSAIQFMILLPWFRRLDGVYGVLGMFKHESRSIVPDYRKSIEAINMEATRILLRQSKDLWPMMEVSHPLEGPSGCSWAHRYDLGRDGDLDATRIDPLDFSAHGKLKGSSLDAIGSDDPNTISLAGMKIDIVSAVGRVYMLSARPTYRELHAWLLTAVQDICVAHAVDPLERLALTDDTIKSLASAMTGARYKPGDEAGIEDVSLGEDLLRAALELDLAGAEPDQRIDTFDRACQRASDNGRLMDMILNRRLLVTRSGRFGVGPKAMRPDDVITAIRGNEVPIVLRYCEADYQYIGVAYVHGLMYGETIPRLRASGGHMQSFVVR
nr:hypothetical protein B0A51_01316 [Rachicladosporium sp. CCFEE 5018]